MATHFSPGVQAPGSEPRRADISQPATSSPDTLAPILAGARARGIADAFEMIGEGAILLDFSGSVLHVGQMAKPMLGCGLAVTGGHVVALSRKSADSLQRLIEAGLADSAPRVLEEDLLCAEEGMRQRVRLFRAPSGDAYQILASVMVLEPPRRVRCRRGARHLAEGEKAA
ncbi:MAG: hypothetical protein ACK4MV_21175 [Beijerinckiaceae bacterium]